MDDQRIAVLIDLHRSPGLAFLVLRQKLLEVRLHALDVRIIDADDDDVERIDELRRHLVRTALVRHRLDLHVPVHIFRADDAEDLPLPDIGQTLGTQDAAEGLVPGDPAEIDGDLALDLVLDENVLIGDARQGPQHRLDVRLAHLEADQHRRQLFRGDALGLLVLGDLRRKIHRLRLEDRRVTRRVLRHRMPFVEERVLFFRLLRTRATGDQHPRAKQGHPDDDDFPGIPFHNDAPSLFLDRNLQRGLVAGTVDRHLRR